MKAMLISLNEKRRKANRDTFIVVGVCIVNFLIRIPAITNPTYWDEMIYFQNAIELTRNNLNPFISQWVWVYKPPVIFMLPALCSRFLYPSLIWGRLEIFFLSSAALYFLYRLGERTFSSRIGLYSALLCVCFPLFTVVSYWFVDAIPFTAFFLASLYYYISGKPRQYALFSTLLVLTKETGIFLPVTLILYTFLLRYWHDTTQKYSYIRFSFYLILPILAFFSWMAINKILFGWYLYPDQVMLFNFLNILNQIKNNWVIKNIYLKDGIWVIFTTVLMGMTFLTGFIKQKIWEEIRFMYFILLIITGYFLFHLAGPISARYFLFLFPILFLLYSRVLSIYITNRFLLFGIIVFTCIMFIGLNINDSFRGPVLTETSYAYLRQIYSTKKLIMKLQKEYSDAFITAGWYISAPLTYPIFGYVTTQVKYASINSCNDFNTTTLKILRKEQVNQRKIIFVSYSKYETISSCSSLRRINHIDSVCPDQAYSTDDCFQIYSFSL